MEPQHERLPPAGAPAHPHLHQVLQDLRRHRIPQVHFLIKDSATCLSISRYLAQVCAGELEALRQAEADGRGHRGHRQDDAARTAEAGEWDILGVSPEAGTVKSA